MGSIVIKAARARGFIEAEGWREDDVLLIPENETGSEVRLEYLCVDSTRMARAYREYAIFSENL